MSSCHTIHYSISTNTLNMEKSKTLPPGKQFNDTHSKSISPFSSVSSVLRTCSSCLSFKGHPKLVRPYLNSSTDTIRLRSVSKDLNISTIRIFCSSIKLINTSTGSLFQDSLLVLISALNMSLLSMKPPMCTLNLGLTV